MTAALYSRSVTLMKLSAEARNDKIRELLAGFIAQAKGTKSEISYPAPFLKEEVESLFTSHIWGHREITLTIILARLLDPSFQASKDFYACNPRSIYEHPIRELLRKNGIPHKKSGPLNVAKNSQRIDETWAHNKRGDGMALKVAGIVKKIESVPPATLRKFAASYVRRYLLEAKKVAKLRLRIEKTEDPVFLNRLCRDLIQHVPDGGTTPQVVVGLLIKYMNDARGATVKISGVSDSVSTTNTTSKKPGDVIEEFPGSAPRVYEITVKKFSIDRMIESHEAIKAWDKKGEIAEVSVICRSKDVPEEADGSEAAPLLGVAKHEDVLYYFIDIFVWIQAALLSMPPQGRKKFHEALIAHVNRINTSEKVKRYLSAWQ